MAKERPIPLHQLSNPEEAKALDTLLRAHPKAKPKKRGRKRKAANPRVRARKHAGG